MAAWRILLVDDEPDIVESLVQLLEVSFPDAVVHGVGSGQQAIDHLEKGPYDLVISDFQMPGMDGLQLLSIVQQRWPDTARVILSAYDADRMGGSATLERVANAIYSKADAPGRIVDSIDRFRDPASASSS